MMGGREGRWASAELPARSQCSWVLGATPGLDRVVSRRHGAQDSCVHRQPKGAAVGRHRHGSQSACFFTLHCFSRRWLSKCPCYALCIWPKSLLCLLSPDHPLWFPLFLADVSRVFMNCQTVFFKKKVHSVTVDVQYYITFRPPSS